MRGLRFVPNWEQLGEESQAQRTGACVGGAACPLPVAQPPVGAFPGRGSEAGSAVPSAWKTRWGRSDEIKNPMARLPQCLLSVLTVSWFSFFYGSPRNGTNCNICICIALM